MSGRPGPSWLFVDGSSLIFRAFHGVPKSVRGPEGQLVNAVRGFMETLARLVTTRTPHRIAVAADADWRPAWRVELMPGYKLQRVPEPIPPELAPQMPVIEQFLDAIGIDFVGVPGYEAEDVIATWTAQATGSVEIVSGDRDLFALVEQGRVVVLYPEKTGLALVDADEVSRRYGIPGDRYADFAILRGDPSDGLPGLRGVGAVAAAQLVKRYGGVDGMLRDSPLSDRDRQYLINARRVVSPVRDVPVSLPDGRRETYPVSAQALELLHATYGLAATGERLVAALRATIASADTPAAAARAAPRSTARRPTSAEHLSPDRDTSPAAE